MSALKIKTDGAKPAYVNLENSHLLTLRDPRPALENAKRKREQEAENRKKQKAADIAHLASIPRADLEKECILAAAERLPKIAGLEIISSRTSTPPIPEHDPEKYLTLVHIAAKAAGVNAEYNFVCARGARTPVFIERYAP